MGKDSASGSFWLFFGKILSTLVLAIGTIVLGLVIQEGEYGLYVIALIPSATILLFHDWGVGPAMIKYIAQYRAKGMFKNLRKILVVGLTFEIGIGLILTLFSLLSANYFASAIFSKPDIAFFMMIASVSIISASVLTGVQSIFVGFERMKLNSITLISQAVVQASVSLLLVYFGFGALGVILGFVFSFSISAIVGFIMLYFLIIRKLPHNEIPQYAFLKTIKPLLTYGVPLGITTVLRGIMAQVYSFIIASFVNEVLVGNYHMALNFSVFIKFFAGPISTVLFPAFSKIDPQTEPDLLKTVFKSSVKYSTIFLIPASMALIVLSSPLIGTLYGDKWFDAQLFLSLAAIIHLFDAFGILSVNSLLTANGETKLLLKLNLLSISIGIPLGFWLIPQFGVPGLFLVDIIDTFPGMVIALYWTWKRYGVRFEPIVSTKILLSSGFASVATFLFLNFFTASDWIKLISGSPFFLITYLITLPLVGAVNQEDLKNLKTMFSSLGIVSKLLNILLLIIKKILLIKQASREYFSVHNRNK